ncbi:DNA-binding protein [Bacillus cereus]|uniref:DNA-binding protein n=1 Tax=Bacillus cereus TaxID=1396 RepID=A0A9X7GXA3_BACCE|nr:AAA family ATPase [Bacillus cereus]PGS81656.1 DNA-binding protein [Bacillus cereus]
MKIKKASDISRTDLWRVLLYGTAGLGKTSAIKGLSGKTLVLDLDGSSRVLSGLKNVDVIEFDRNNPTQAMNDFLKEVNDVLPDYINLVIDNITSFQSDWFVEQGKKSHNGISNELQHYGTWTNYFLRLLTALYSLPVNIYVTAWESTVEIKLESGQIITKYVPQIREQVLNQLLGLTDVVGRIKVNEKTGARGAILEGNDGLYAKNRLDNRKACKIEELFKFGDVKDETT